MITPKENPPKGKFLESLGSYDPFTKEKIFNKERILYWVGNGAQLSASVNNLLIRERAVEGKKMRSHSTRKRKKKEGTGGAAVPPGGGEASKTPEAKVGPPKEKTAKEETKEEISPEAGT